MKPDPAAPADQLNLLRQQLILAQVRIMELEDTRDTLQPRVEELERLLTEAQTLADRKTDEATHLGNVLADCQARGAELQALQARAGTELAALRAAQAEAERHLAGSRETVARLEAGLKQLETELQTIRASRSWRWTAWLR